MASPEQEHPEQQQQRTGNGDYREQVARAQSKPEREEDGRAREGGRSMRSLATHFADLTREVSALVRDETALARAEIAEDVSQIKKGTASLIVGGGLALGGLLFLLGAATFALALIWPLWLSYLVVGLAALILGGIAALVARKMTKPANLTLDRTMESGRSIGQTAKEAVR